MEFYPSPESRFTLTNVNWATDQTQSDSFLKWLNPDPRHRPNTMREQIYFFLYPAFTKKIYQKKYTIEIIYQL